MEAPKKQKQLTELERRFAAEYAVCCNGAQAARAAGYSDSATGSARVMAHKLMKKPAVRELVDRLIAARAERVELRGDQIVADLQRLARWSLVPVAVLDRHGRETGVERPLDGPLAARCLELLGKTLALFVDRKQTDFSGEVELTWSPVVSVEADAEPMDDWPADKPPVEVLPTPALESGDDPEQSEQDPEPAERPRFGGAVL